MRLRRFVCLLLICCLLAGLAACKDAGSTEPTATAPSSADATEALVAVQTGDLTQVVKSTEHFSFTLGDMAYIFGELYVKYAYMLSMYGYDIDHSLKLQYINETTTVFQYLLDNAEQMTDYYLLLAEAAYERGLGLSDEDKEFLQQQRDGLAEEAASHGWSVDTYLGQYFRTNITLEMVQHCTEIFMLADKGEEAILEEYPVTEEMIRARFEENPKAYLVVDYYAINLAESEGIALDDMEVLVNEFDAVESLDAFRTAVRHFLDLSVSAEKQAEIGDMDAYTETFLADSKETAVNYVSSSPFFEWAFGEDAQPDRCWIAPEETNGYRMVYFLSRAPYEQVKNTVDIRHILFKTSDYDNDAAKARAKAEEIYAAWVAAGAKEEEFITLCAQYSADGNAQSGGIYEDVEEGMMVKTFNDWIFDASRKYGDHGIVDTEYGSHMMFFIASHSTVVWEETVREALLDEVYDRFVNDLMEKYPIQVNREVLSQLVW